MFWNKCLVFFARINLCFSATYRSCKIWCKILVFRGLCKNALFVPLLGTNMAEMKTYVHKSCIWRIRKEWGGGSQKRFCKHIGQEKLVGRNICVRVCPGCRMNCTQGSLKKSQLGMKTKSRPFRGTAFLLICRGYYSWVSLFCGSGFSLFLCSKRSPRSWRGPLWRSRRSLPSRCSPLGSRRGRRAGRSS